MTLLQVLIGVPIFFAWAVFTHPSFKRLVFWLVDWWDKRRGPD